MASSRAASAKAAASSANAEITPTNKTQYVHAPIQAGRNSAARLKAVGRRLSIDRGCGANITIAAAEPSARPFSSSAPESGPALLPLSDNDPGPELSTQTLSRVPAGIVRSIQICRLEVPVRPDTPRRPRVAPSRDLALT